MERLKSHFRRQGLTASDIPKAIVLHEVIGVGMAIGFWTVCYTLQPSSTFFRPVSTRLSRNVGLQKGYMGAMAQAERTVQKFTWLQRLPLVRNDVRRWTVSLAESICLRAAIKPATFPFKIWASYKLVLATKPRMHHTKL